MVTSTNYLGGQEAYKKQLAQDQAANAKKSPQQSCQESGGIWDAQTGTCLRVQAPATPAPVSKSGTSKGDTSGVKNMFGQTREEVEAIKLKAKEMAAGVGAKELMGQQAQRKEAATAAQGLGLTPEQIAQAEAQAVNSPIDVGQAITAGTVKNAPSLIKSIGIGAAGGLAAAAPISAGLAATGIGAVPAAAVAVGGAAIGAINAIWGGVQSNIANQQRGEIGAAQDVLSNSKMNMKKLATLAAKDPANAQRYVEAYNQQLAQVYTARRKIFLETQGNLNKFTEDGTDILSDFDLFLQPYGQADLFKIKLDMAMSSGLTPDFTEEDFEMIL